MIERALEAGITADWVTGDEVYGDNPRLRAALEERGQNYVLAVSCRHHITTAAGKFRRRNRRTGELACYLCYSTHPTTLRTLAKTAGCLWTVEETFQSSKGLAGLDEHQVRRWTSWHRWVTLAMLAHAFLAVVTALGRDQHRTTSSLSPLTRNEVQHLFTTPVSHAVHDTAHRLCWSQWRRRHQARAQIAHYRRQDAQPA